MPGAANVQFNEVDDSINIGSLSKGLSAVILKTKRGPVGHDGSIMTTWEQFKKKYGDILGAANDEGALIAYRALTIGAKLRVCRVLHYTTPSNPATLDAVKASSETVQDATDDLFSLTAKYHGADYNNLQIVISDADNGDANYFNLVIQHTSDTLVFEEYTNLTITGTPTAEDSDYLLDIEQSSEFVDVTYEDLSALTGPLRPDNGTYAFSTGSDGSALVDADYVGASGAYNGIYAFDNYDDFFQIAVLGGSYDPTAIGTPLVAYAANRKDCAAIVHLDNSNTSASSLVTERNSLPDSNYQLIYAGGEKILDPKTGSIREIAETGAVLGTIARVHSNPSLGEWHSFAGKRKASLPSSLGPVNNFGSKGQFENRDLLARRQINLLLNRGGTNYLDGNFTGQLASSLLSYANVRYLMLYLRKILLPYLENFLEEPTIPRTWKSMYLGAKPILDSLTTEEAAGLIRYEWQGDQFVNSRDDVEINNTNDLDQGRYKVKLILVPVVSMQEIVVSAILTRSGVDLVEEA